MSTPRIIIIGGGFSGVKCAQVLCDQLPHRRAEIVIFNDENHLVFSPLLAEVVGSSINPLDVVVPLRQLLPRVLCRTEAVQSVELATNEITYEAEDGGCARMHYDQLVIACGNVANLNVVPGMADHAFPLKTVGDAAALRSQIMERMEQAEVCPDPDRRRWRLTFIVVGGGFSGAEVAGEINDLVRDTARYFRNFTPEEVNVTLIHSRDQILPEISSDLREFARKKMEKAGVKFLLNARVALATPDGVGVVVGQASRLPAGRPALEPSKTTGTTGAAGGTPAPLPEQSRQFIRGGTIVCTIGSSAAPILERLAVPKEKGRLVTQPDMRLRDSANVWAIGDCALVTNAHDGQPSPTTGQFAERQGKQCAQNIVRVLDNQATKPFFFKQLGELCSIGGHSAVADLLGVHLSGFVAWFVWRGVYLFKLPTWARRMQVGFDWAWLLPFPRDLAHIRTRQTDRVSRAHYEPGNVIIKQGEPPSSFYIIQQGEVEVVRATPTDPSGEVVAVLGPGSFFGEKALLNDEPRVATVRARTAVEVLVLGKNIFTQVSEALTPLRDALAQALNRRAIDVWKDEPQALDLLKHTTLKDLMEPLPQPLLKPETTLTEVSRAFVQTTNEFFYVSSDGASLEGVVTITDLLRGRAAGATSATPVSEFMTKNPVVLAADDNCAIAATSLREYRLKSLPVVERKDNRRLVGCIRVRRLMALVFKELGN